MIYDTDYVGCLYTADTLVGFVVIHKYHVISRNVQKASSCYKSRVSVFIIYGKPAVSGALQHYLCIIEQVMHIKSRPLFRHYLPDAGNRGYLVVAGELTHRPVRYIVNGKKTVEIVLLIYGDGTRGVLLVNGGDSRKRIIRIDPVIGTQHNITYLRIYIAHIFRNVDVKLPQYVSRTVGQMSASYGYICIVGILQVHKLRVAVCAADAVKIRIPVPRYVYGSHAASLYVCTGFV